MSNTDISIIIINFNTWHFLDPCVTSIMNYYSDITYELIVVDNDSTDESRKCIRRKYPQIILICNDENTGFARANNQAINIAKGRYCFFLNADTLILNAEITGAIQYMDANRRVGIMAPQQLLADGKPALTFSHDKSFREHKKSLFLDACYLGKFRCITKRIPEQVANVGYVNGAAMIVRRQLIDKIGSFDEQFFFMAEEKDFAFRCHNAGFDIVYYPDCKVIHYGASRKGLTLWGIMQYHESNFKLFNKYKSSATHAAFIFSLGLLTAACSSIVSLITRQNKRLHAYRTGIYLKTLLWHLSGRRLNWNVKVK